MFDIAWSELLVIAVVALIFIGPKELPSMLHTLGRFVRKIRNHADDFRRQFDDSMRDGGYQDLQKNLQDFRALNPAGQLKDSIKRAIDHDYSKPAPVPETPQANAPQGADAAKTASAGTPAAAEVSALSQAEGPGALAPATPAIPTAPQVDIAAPLTVPVPETAPAKAAIEAEKTSAEPAVSSYAPASQAVPAKPLEPQAAASDPAKDRIAPAA
ncbi:twin-arginine translocation protein, TatB subunit [Rhodomicrobium vannielii ATCC 17100]|uniref:Sec-independent protein translocase protein TatB n=1 Tax=Rhodomicrobium vannielii (strain ATCC 17100 / DSM 162 / LMG 4299 / NCIMB 10020 / ATH 3.1.1) TaxID=648757 RepID=E3I0G3_RHOVT|nr:Sec-independent protein translocase protein TatB [Rhodomicrobium vannielii]ADP72281.1 twin-arginine translocation protein, TatB subunit [Rhodomicrobium vannielii ATCC 17100]